MKYKAQQIGLTALSVLFFVGCLQNKQEEGSYIMLLGTENNSGTDISKDISNMGAAFEMQDFGGTTLLKKSAVPASQDTLNLSLQPWLYNDGWWTRSATANAVDDQGGQILLEGSDRVQWKTPDNTPVQFPRLQGANSGTIIHSGQIYLQNQNGGYIDINRDYDLTGVITSSGTDSTLTFNGSLEQSFKAENAAETLIITVKGTATATNVTWNRKNGSWGKPASGTIHMESNYRIIDITFDDGKAHIEVVGKQDNFSNSYSINL